jgi:hypothetical protein
MTNARAGARQRAAAALTVPLLLLVAGGCSDDAPAPAPTTAAPTPSKTATAAPGPTSTPRSTLPPPATTPVPQESPGDVNSEVPTQPEKSRKPVDLDKPSDAGDKVSVRLTKLASIDAKAEGPGEVAGSALAVTVLVRNASSKAVDLNAVVVTLEGADQAPGGLITTKPAAPLDGQLAPGKSRSGVYVFTVAPDNRDPVTIAVTLAGGGTVLLYTGKP